MATSEPTKNIGITTCPICLEDLNAPRCLPCLHNFCETCLNSHIITAFKSESESKVGKSQFHCPVCTETVTPPDPVSKHQEWSRQFPLNNLIVSLVHQNKLKANCKVCDPCKSMDDDVTAISWCHDCNEALCEMCVNVHKKLKISRFHDLKNIGDIEAEQVVPSMQLCEIHDGKYVEAFCNDHNHPCCATCVAFFHCKCDHVATLEQAAAGIMKSKDLSDLLERMKGASDLNQTIIRDKKENIKELEDKKCDIQKELQETRQRIIDSFDKMHSTFMQKLTDNHTNKVKELNESIIQIENKEKIIQNQCNLLETSKTRSNEIQVFLEMKKIRGREKQQVEELEQILAKHKRVKYEFRMDDDIEKLITRLQTVGQIDVMENASLTTEKYPNPESPAYKHLKECMPRLEVSFSTYDKCEVNAWAYGGCFMSDNTLVLPLFRKKRLAVLKSNGDLIKQGDDLSGDLYDVCMIDPTTAVVAKGKGQGLDFIDIATLTVNKTVRPVDVSCYGITCSDNKLYVGCKDKLLILDRDGKKEKEIQTDEIIRGIAIINLEEKKIVYTASKNHSCHFVRSSDLQEVHRFTHPELKCPRGVTSDREGNVYVAGYSLGNVFQLSSEGDLIRVLIRGLNGVCGIKFDGDRFFVSYSCPAKLNIYHMVKL